ncbi:ribosomal RNA large subunit methyltransferase F [Alishewanella longhuensis]
MQQKVNALHPRNPHQGSYDLSLLCKQYPALRNFIVLRRPVSGFDFSNAKAVQSLNAALLASYYQIHFWQLPEGYLCPPIRTSRLCALCCRPGGRVTR